ncbi:hypothetical protein AAHA92_25658 [Salvia divinorum]|uniref:Secreted protein n=1 Tax=Salvia divinorum TaxID=28513 RepID=A0ABD1GBE9_SALDI
MPIFFLHKIKSKSLILSISFLYFFGENSHAIPPTPYHFFAPAAPRRSSRPDVTTPAAVPILYLSSVRRLDTIRVS